MKSKHIASYQPSPSGVTSMYTFFALFLSRILLSFKSKLCIFHHSWETVSNLLCSCYWNSKKKLEVDIFSHTPTLLGKILLQVLIIIFFENLFYSSAESQGRVENYDNSGKLTIVSLTGYVNRFCYVNQKNSSFLVYYQNLLKV